jgi:hypothetical protein
MFRRFGAAVLPVALATAAAAQDKLAPGPVGQPSGAINEQLWWVPMEQPRQKGVIVHLETTVYRPNASAPMATILSRGGARAIDGLVR